MRRTLQATISRGISLLLLLVTAVVGPWWATFTILAFFSYRFPRFYEGILAGILIDLLYAPPEAGVFLRAQFTFYAALIILAVTYVRRFLRVGLSVH